MASFGPAIFGIFWGYLADKYGTPWFGLIASIVMAISLFFLGQQSNLFHFYILYFILGAFGSSLVGSPLFANVGFWFRRNPDLAIGIAAAGGSAGQGFLPLITGIFIENSGQQKSYLYLSAIYLLVAIPFYLLIKECPSRHVARLSNTDEIKNFPLSEKEVVIWMSIAVIFCCICMSVPIVHLVPLLTDNNFSVASATSVLMLLMFFGIFGRISGGKLGDLIGALHA